VRCPHYYSVATRLHAAMQVQMNCCACAAAPVLLRLCCCWAVVLPTCGHAGAGALRSYNDGSCRLPALHACSFHTSSLRPAMAAMRIFPNVHRIFSFCPPAGVLDS